MEKNTDMKYMWSIKIYDSNNLNVVDVRPCENQIFSVPNKEEQEIEFHEKIRILPGSYIVRLLLYRNEPGFNLSNANQPNFDRAYSVWRFGEKINVQN